MKLLPLLFALAACGVEHAPPALTPLSQDASFAAPDAGSADTLDAAPTAADLAGLCRSACDCPAGQACAGGRCQIATPMVFCCARCTGSDLCEDATSGLRQCSQPPDAGIPPDGGLPGACGVRACVAGAAGDAYCRAACDSAGGRCVTSQGSGAHCQP